MNIISQLCTITCLTLGSIFSLNSTLAAPLQGVPSFPQKEQGGKALSLLEQAARLSPKDTKILYALTGAYLKLKKYKLAQATLDLASQYSPNSFETRFLSGELLFYQGQFTQALGYFKPLYEQKSNTLALHYYLAHIYAKQSDIHNLEQHLTQGLLARGGSLEHRASLLQLKSTLVEPSHATPLFREILDLAPFGPSGEKVWPIYLNHLKQEKEKDRINILFLNRFTQALKQGVLGQLKMDLEAYRLLDSNLQKLFFMSAKIETLLEKYPKIEVLKEFQEWLYYENNQNASLLRFYRQELLLNNDLLPLEKGRLFKKIGDTHLKMGFTQFAYDNYERALSFNSADEYSSLQMGLIHLSRRHFGQAKAIFVRIAQISPENKSARLYLAFTYAFSGQLEKAEKILYKLPGHWAPKSRTWLRTVIALQKKEKMPHLFQLLREKDSRE